MRRDRCRGSRGGDHARREVDVRAAIGWTVVRRFAEQPERLLRWLVPVVVVVSFVPDLALLGSGIPASGPLAVVALMVMHVVVAAVAVSTYRRVLPLPVR